MKVLKTMIKKSFLGLSTPRLEYEKLLTNQPKPLEILPQKNAMFFLDYPFEKNITQYLKEGDPVKTGQKLSFKNGRYLISSVTGTVASIASHAGNFNHLYTAVSVAINQNENKDTQFSKLSDSPSIDTVKDYLLSVPGKLPESLFTDKAKSFDTIIVCAADSDLLITTNQYILKNNTHAVKNGIDILKEITSINNIIIIAPKFLQEEASATGAKVKCLDLTYPSALPHMIMKDVLNRIVPAQKTCEDMGVCFISAEAVASIGNAFENNQIPVTKLLNVVKKDKSNVLVSARIGTPIDTIFKSVDIKLNEKDRIIIGGPMKGCSVYSDNHPVLSDTDAIIIQDSASVSLVSDNPCTNCGECIRICPVNVPVNMLVRFLEAGLYVEACEQYDLFSCIECGLCSYVCISKIPILQYITLAKHELGRMERNESDAAEEING